MVKQIKIVEIVSGGSLGAEIVSGGGLGVVRGSSLVGELKLEHWAPQRTSAELSHS